MISEQAYVWVWLPDASEPVVAGRLRAVADTHTFTYGRSYLEREGAIPLFLPELPLEPKTHRPDLGWEAHGCILDAGPDYWGRRVITARHHTKDDDLDAVDELPLLRYLLESGSDRIGGLDFQESATEYVPRTRDHNASLADLLSAADDIAAGRPVPLAIDTAILHGTSIGGARPKALIDDGEDHLIAKFSTTTDSYPMVKGEAIAMHLAKDAGLNVAGTRIHAVGERDVLLVERFDRTQQDHRRLMVTALTILHRRAFGDKRTTYPDLAHAIRARFTRPQATLRELYSRIVFNVLVGNTDDHAKNHSAFWDGRDLTLTPAYDVSPQPRSGGEVTHAMAIAPNGDSRSRLEVCRKAASTYLLGDTEAKTIIDELLTVVEDGFVDAADMVGATERDRATFWRRSFLNPSIHYTDD